MFAYQCTFPWETNRNQIWNCTWMHSSHQHRWLRSRGVIAPPKTAWFSSWRGKILYDYRVSIHNYIFPSGFQQTRGTETAGPGPVTPWYNMSNVSCELKKPEPEGPQPPEPRTRTRNLLDGNWTPNLVAAGRCTMAGSFFHQVCKRSGPIYVLILLIHAYYLWWWLHGLVLRFYAGKTRSARKYEILF